MSKKKSGSNSSNGSNGSNGSATTDQHQQLINKLEGRKVQDTPSDFQSKHATSESSHEKVEPTAQENVETETSSFQERVNAWRIECFGPDVLGSKRERNQRFLEECLELAQACNCSREEAHKIVDHVFNRPAGDVHQEVGGVMLTLAALCTAQDKDMYKAAEDHLTEVYSRIPQIREEQRNTPIFSALPTKKGSLL